MKVAIHWFRRDLRLSDNTALHAAAQQAERVVPVFILEDAFKTGPDVGAARLEFLLQALKALRRNLQSCGYELIVRQGRSEVELPKLCQEIKAEAVFCNRRYEPYAQARDGRVFNALNAIGVGFEVFKDAVIWEEREVLTKAGNPYTVFTPYAKAWRERKVPRPQPSLPARSGPKLRVPSDGLPASSATLGHALSHPIPPAGEEAAQKVLNRFLSGPVLSYAAQRNYPALEGTSSLSPHLRCGSVGIRTILAGLSSVRARASAEERRSCDVFLNELIWREFYLQVLSNFPHVMTGSFRPEYDQLRWSENREPFDAWCAGQTGYPIVDAAMRCLKATGWMHNRLRMITAMFLTKDLLLNWRWGERYFMQRLVDGDMAANNGGWQWSAGTGTDAAPYFRIFNPVAQGQKFDSDGAFVRRWVPELSRFSGNAIHQPWAAASELAACKYSKRIVVHEEQRPKCLAMYRKVTRPKAR